MCPNLNSLESLFVKEGLREFGDRGLEKAILTFALNSWTM